MPQCPTQRGGCPTCLKQTDTAQDKGMTRSPRVPHLKTRGGQLMEDSRVIEAIVPKTESDGPPGLSSVNSLTPPLHPGWRVAVKGRRDVEYVASCEWNGMTWIATLQSGRQIPVSQITAVGKVNDRGRTIVAWDVRAHGISGNERETR